MKTCRTCAAPINRRNKSGLCRACIAHDREMQLKRIEASRRAYQARPEILAAATARLVAETQKPEHAERSRRMMIEQRLWERGAAARGEKGSPANRKMARTLSATRLSHIPPELRDEYRHLVKIKRFSAAEASRMVAELHKAEMARFRARIAPAGDTESKVVPILSAGIDRGFPEAEQVVALVAWHFGVEPDVIFSGSRRRAHTRPRYAVMKALRLRGWSLVKIGQFLGGRDHTTIRSGITYAEEYMASDDAFAAIVAAAVALERTEAA